jgi:hypothetical protein
MSIAQLGFYYLSLDFYMCVGARHIYDYGNARGAKRTQYGGAGATRLSHLEVGKSDFSIITKYKSKTIVW